MISDEEDRLLEIDVIEPYQYPRWLSNVVVVKKKNGKWRVCIDFTNLNKACLKDSYPLPKIDQLVDATAGYKRMSFLDAYSGYNQIKMNERDRIHTAFCNDPKFLKAFNLENNYGLSKNQRVFFFLILNLKLL